MGLRIAIDTGGTFTDVVAIDEDTGNITSTKTPSTPDDPSIGLVEGVQKSARRSRRRACRRAHAAARLDGGN